MRFRWLIATGALLLTCGLASAQPNEAGPTVEVRLRSINDLVDKAEYVAGLAGKEDAVKQVRELIKVLSADGKGVEGIDPKKPMGLYATLAKEIQTSPFVVMIPIADQDQLLKALKDRVNITPEKGEDDTLKIGVPILNELHLRFTNGYLYISPKAKNLDPKALLKPTAFFAKDDGAVLSVLVHLDRIPSDLKTLVLGQLELGLNEQRKKNEENETAAEKRLKGFVFDTILAGVKGLTEDGKELSVKLFAEARSDDLSAEVTLTATSGSATAKNFAALGQKTSVPAGIVAAPDAAARGNVKIAVTDGTKNEFAATIDALLEEVVKKAPGEHEEAVKAIVAAVGPALRAGELDLAGSLIGPDSKDHYRVIGAVGVKEGKGIEKLIKGLVKQYAQFLDGFVTFKFDEEKIGDFALHRIELKKIDDRFDKIFGTSTIWLATSDKYIVFSVEPDGDTIRKGLKAKAVSVPVVSVDISVAKLLPLIQPDLKPDEVKSILKDAFGDGPTAGKDTIKLSVEGGDKLSIKFKVKGKAVRLFTGLTVLRGR
jgi:hypothetical protein